MTSSEVASHYNAVKQTAVQDRKNSPIFHLRSMNNWIKSMLINEAIDLLREGGTRDGPRVLDIACGKGGDLRKWNIARAKSVVMADIASVSVQQAKARYAEMSEKQGGRIFPAEFIVADCCNVWLPPLISPSFVPLDIVSCQFALHYSFVDLPSARRFVRNCVHGIRPGGLFLGTLPDANRIVWAARSEDKGQWANRVCAIAYDESTPLEAPPLFGAKFHFTLDEQVDCPEYLAFFPLLVQLMKDEGMELVKMERFPDAAQKFLQKPNGKNLLEKMTGLKQLPSESDDPPEDAGDYAHVGVLPAKEETVGTLSRPEWEAFSMYLVFMFKRTVAAEAEDAAPTRKRKAEEEEEEKKKAKREEEEVKEELKEEEKEEEAKEVKEEEMEAEEKTEEKEEKTEEVPTAPE